MIFRFIAARTVLYTVLCIGAFAMAFPFLWMLITSLQSKQESLQQNPVWIPARLNPTNWSAAFQLGNKGGDAWWGGLKPQKTLEIEVVVSGNNPKPIEASIPSESTVDPTLLFSQETAEDLREVKVVSSEKRGNNTVWKIKIINNGTKTYEKVPLTVSLPEGLQLISSSLPPDGQKRDDRGDLLEWDNVAPGFLGYLLANYRDALNAAPFGRYFLNSAITATAQTLFGLIIVALAAFAFAKIDFYGREVIFALVLSSLVIPGEMLLVPNYIILAKLGWTNSYQGIVIPWIASVFGIFLLRQFFKSLPDELFEAARIDGAGYGTMLWRIALPLAKPGLITFSIFSFLGSWNALLWPLIVTSNNEMRTVQVGLQSFIGEAGTQYGQLMAASLLVILPIIIGFFIAQKQFIAGVARSGLK